jgi:hypothetical protein
METPNHDQPYRAVGDLRMSDDKAEPPSLRSYCKAMGGTWFTVMSGPLSVPAAIAALWVASQTAKILLGLTAFACVWAAAYAVWKTERKKLVDLQSASAERTRKKLQLLNEISGLRSQMVNLRVEMDKDRIPQGRRFSDV